eukprot:4241912-Pyramimonas_sp.AAC.1
MRALSVGTSPPAAPARRGGSVRAAGAKGRATGRGMDGAGDGDISRQKPATDEDGVAANVSVELRQTR